VLGTHVNTTGNVTSTESGAGGNATASIDVLALPPAPPASPIPGVSGGSLGVLAILVALAGLAMMARRRRN